MKVVVKKNFVGVVAEKPWQAMQAARQVEGHLDVPAPGLPESHGFYDHLRNQKPTRDTLLVNSKDVDQNLASAATVVKATYLSSLSDARIDGQFLRRGGCAGR